MGGLEGKLGRWKRWERWEREGGGVKVETGPIIPVASRG
jgi:hypothetical protein